MSLLYEEECYKIRGAIFEVYNELGKGFLESVYQESLEKELEMRQIPFISKPELILEYKGNPLSHVFVPDLRCYNKIILELKAVKELLPEHKAQLINYLKVSQNKVGFLVNFGHFPQVQIERVLL